MNDLVKAPRTDAIYNMHSYLTKVPVNAIIPFIEEFTPEDGLVVDMFAGSGMTALAAKIANRRAVVSDISKLGKHIAKGYMAKVEENKFRDIASKIVTESKEDIGWLYNTVKSSDGETTESIRTVWSFIYECKSCGGKLNYYQVFKSAEWQSTKMACNHCQTKFIKKDSKVIGEEPVLVVVKENRQVEQSLTDLDLSNIIKADKLDYRSKIPNLIISEDREMYKRSALKKWGTTETKCFFSQRNSATLYDLWNKINLVEDKNIKQKLRFCFTAILPRASKRYQWSYKAPLNAANQNYYISPVFYEWNIYDLFMRKIEASIKSDKLLFKSENNKNKQEYVTASADELLHLTDESVDLVFTDPPFGSNIFYSDMNLFQEAWIEDVTSNDKEAVIRTTVNKDLKIKSKELYKSLLKKSFVEAYRVLKKGGKLSIVFGNSKGDIWALAQEAFIEAGFTKKPVSIKILDKGQRSVKGLNSGSENVSTLDLIVTLEKPSKPNYKNNLSIDSKELIEETLNQINRFEGVTASHIYLEVLKNAIFNKISVNKIDLEEILYLIKKRGFKVDKSSGLLSEE